MTTVAILGAGAWGTALAIHLAGRAAAHPTVTLWTRDERHARAMAATRVNTRYLPGIVLPAAIAVTSDPHVAAGAELLVAATPAAALPGLAQQFAAAGARAPLIWLSKGFVAAPALPAGVGLAHQVIAPMWPAPVGIVSGPTFAEEVARGLPAALTVAATEPRTLGVGRCAAARRFAARLRKRRPGGRGDRRRDQERARHRRRRFRRPGIRQQRARRIDHAWIGRDRQAVGGAGWQARNADGTGRPGRPRADLHRRPVAQSPRRPGARERQTPACDPGRIGPCRGRRDRGDRRPRAGRAP